MIRWQRVMKVSLYGADKQNEPGAQAVTVLLTWLDLKHVAFADEVGFKSKISG